jgi:hypothetical protein
MNPTIICHYERKFDDEDSQGSEVLETGLCIYNPIEDTIGEDRTFMDSDLLTDTSGTFTVDVKEPFLVASGSWETDGGEYATAFHLTPINVNTIDYQAFSSNLTTRLKGWVKDYDNNID